MFISVLPAYIYLFAWIALSFLPYAFYSQNLYAILLTYFTFSALYYSVYSVTHFKLPVYFKFLFVFIGFLSIYGGYLLMLGDEIYWQDAAMFVEQKSYLLWLITSMLSVVPIYVFSCKGLIGDREIKILFFIMLFSCIFAFRSSYEIQLKLAAMTGSSRDEFTITCVYSFLSILPMIVLFRNKLLLQFGLLSVFIVYFIMSAKRGPIILGGACAVLLIWFILHSSSIRKKIVISLISFVCIFALYKFIIFQLENSPYFALRIDQTMDGYTSGRDEYGKIVFDYFVNKTNTKEFFLGIGAQGTLSVNESFAHNDWLAILLEQGLVGGCFFLLYWIGFVYTWIKTKGNSDAFVAIGLLLLIGLGKTFFSMYYLPISPEMIISSGFFAIALGFFLAKAYPQNECFIIPLDIRS